MGMLGIGLVLSGILGFLVVFMHDGIEAPQPAWWSYWIGYGSMVSIIVGILLCIYAVCVELSKAMGQ